MEKDLIEQLNELRIQAEDAFKNSVKQSKMSNHYYITSIMQTPGITSNEKLVLIEMIINERYTKDGITRGTVAQKNTGLGKPVYNKAARGLVKKGLIAKVNRCYYKINVVY